MNFVHLDICIILIAISQSNMQTIYPQKFNPCPGVRPQRIDIDIVIGPFIRHCKFVLHCIRTVQQIVFHPDRCIWTEFKLCRRIHTLLRRQRITRCQNRITVKFKIHIICIANLFGHIKTKVIPGARIQISNNILI